MIHGFVSVFFLFLLVLLCLVPLILTIDYCISNIWHTSVEWSLSGSIFFDIHRHLEYGHLILEK